MLKKDEIHFFNDIAYWHVPFTHCPTGEKLRTQLKCSCNPKENFDWKGYSCTLPPPSFPFPPFTAVQASSSACRAVGIRLTSIPRSQARRGTSTSRARRSPRVGRTRAIKALGEMTSERD
jgi:hypothetical protein